MKKRLTFLEFLKKVEWYVTIIGVIVIVLFNIVAQFINVQLIDKWLNENVPFIVITSSTFLLMFIHTMFEQFFSMQPRYSIAKLRDENKHIYEKLFSKATQNICTTHIYALPIPEGITDSAKKYLDKKNSDVNREREFEFKRIIGIIDETDLKFAKENLELINEFKGVKIEIYLLDLTKYEKLNIFPNIVISDNEEALLSFPIRLENETRGIYLKGKEAINHVLDKYWSKLREDAIPISKEEIERIEGVLKPNTQHGK